MTAPQLPDPLVPPEVDLRGYDFMPLHWERLFKSETWIGAKSDHKIAMLNIWCHAFGRELPASSLPQNDQLLATYAGFGMGVAAWRRARTVVLRGFVECSDGRLYHGFLGSVAMSSWRARLSDRLRGIKGRIASTEKKLIEPKEAANRAHWQRLLDAQQQELSQLTAWAVTAQSWALSQPPVTAHCDNLSPQTRKRSEVKGSEGKLGDQDQNHTGGGSTSPSGSQPPRAAAIAVKLRAWEKDRGKVTKIHSAEPRVQEWASAGITDEQLREAYDIAVSERAQGGDDGPINAGFLHVFVQKLLNPKAQKGAPLQQREWHETHAGVIAKARELGYEPKPDDDPRWLKCVIAVRVGGDHWPWIDAQNETQQRWIAELREDAERTA